MSDAMILAINPDSYSTKIAVYRLNKIVFLKSIRHPEAELNKYEFIADQTEFRTKSILTELENNVNCPDHITVIMARGGLIKPLNSGIYEVNQRMIEDLTAGVMGQHANNLGGLIANALIEFLPEAKAYIADPVVVDELNELARVSGHPLFERKSVFHALVQKSVARKHAKSMNRDYNDLNLIVVHVESGVSIAAHHKGQVVDVNQALDGEGPFSFERSGTLPVGDLLKMAVSGKYEANELYSMIHQEGGVKAYLGTSNLGEIQKRIQNGDNKAVFIMDAMAYQIAKSIGSMYAALNSSADAIVLSGEIFHWKLFTDSIMNRVTGIGPVGVYPNEEELEALARNGALIIEEQVVIKEYI
jgi:butyrate kinase